MADFIYRFRSTDALLGSRAELEKQEIYFASPKQLNDPLEGYKDLFWKGDVIVWKNFLRHYVLCLMQAVLLALEHGEEYEITEDNLPFRMIDDDLHPEVRKLYDAMCEKMFGDPELAPLPELLQQRVSPIRRNELLSLLWSIHFQLFKSVCITLQPEAPFHPLDAIFRERDDRPLRLRKSFAALNDWDAKNAGKPDIVEAMTAKSVSAIEQTTFIHDYSGMSQKYGPAWKVIASTFPEVYLNSLENLLYGDWYTACFVADPRQASMWGHYGDSHRGVCLKFKTSTFPSGEQALSLNRQTAISGTVRGTKRITERIYEYSPQPLQEVRYADLYAEVDFFGSLGTLIPRQRTFWFRGGDGALSATGKELVWETEEWRKRYWDTFHMAVTTKLKDWQHEREYRITLQSWLADLSIPSERTLRYRFEDLQGIIFGIKTTAYDKAAIVRIVQAKCNEVGRTDFEFCQAYYSRLTGRVETTAWDLVKFR
jgi:hypothetical protein